MMHNHFEIPPGWTWTAKFYMSVLGIVFVGIIAFLEILPAMVQPAGTSAVVVAALWALVPVVFTLALVWIVDCWEPEPWWMYAIAFIWGSGVAVVGGAAVNDFASKRLLPHVLSEFSTDADILHYTASWVAPISEELVKAFGIILIYLLFRHYFNGPVDGIVYGALVGAGFGFTENVLYFVRNYDALTQVFTVRFLDGPFNHNTYTALAGFFIGFAEYSAHRGALLRWSVPAILTAGLFHFINNDALYWSGMTYGHYKFISNIPLAIVALGMVIYARNYERQAVLGGLEGYVLQGWFARHEVVMISRLKYRRQAVFWAENQAMRHGHSATEGIEAMQQFQNVMLHIGHEITRAHRRRRSLSTGDQAYVSSLLSEAQDLRQVFAPQLAGAPVVSTMPGGGQQ